MILIKYALVVAPFSPGNQQSLVLDASWPFVIGYQTDHQLGFWLYHFRFRFEYIVSLIHIYGPCMAYHFISKSAIGKS